MFKKINKIFVYKFGVDVDGVYSLAIEANCQNGENLRVEIDNRAFREIPIQNRIHYFKIPPAWNGNELKGLNKQVIFVLKLDKGEHSITFIPQGGAIINLEPIVSLLFENKLSINAKAQDGNRRPWITIVLADLKLKMLDVSVTCEKRKRDSDDVKLIIDGDVQKNTDSGWWGKNWYWRGRNLAGNTKETRFYPNLAKDTHYLEFWADRMPVLNWIELDLDIKEDDGSPKLPLNMTVMKYKNKGQDGQRDYNRYDEFIAKAVTYWNVFFLNDLYPVKEPLDPDLVKAIIYKESKVGYHHGGEINVMQVGNAGDPSLLTLNGTLKEWEIINGEQWKVDYDGKANAKSIEASIHWGVRWLYHKAHGIRNNQRYWNDWKTAVKLYGPGSKEPDYQDCVWKIYKEGIDDCDGGGIPIKLWSIILIAAGMLIFAPLKTDASLGKFYYNKNKSLFLTVDVLEKDWWEDLKVGKWLNGKIQWLKIENPPTEQSILSARFVYLKGFDKAIIEVYGETHVGHGSINLYEVIGERVSLLFRAPAVDSYNEHIWNPANPSKYGYFTCGQTYDGDKLFAKYKDINHDGISDIVLSGKADVLCDDDREEVNDGGYPIIKVLQYPIRKNFIWDPYRHVFLE